MLNLELSKKVEERMVELLNNNTLTMDCELQIFEAIASKYKFKTLSNYAKKEQISYNGAKYLVKSGKIQYVKVANTIFCF
jgi:ubiquinone biosynthesis protein UbiJ